MGKFIQSILSVYENESLEIRRKSRLLLVSNLLFILISLISMVFAKILIAQDYVSAAMNAVMIAVLIAAVVLLKKGKFLVASNVSIVLLACTMALLCIVGKDIQMNSALSKLGLYLLPVIIYSGMIGIKTWQSLVASALACFAPLVFFLTGPLFLQNYRYNAHDAVLLVTSLLVIMAAGLMAYLILKNNGEIIRMAEKESGINRDKNKKIEAIVNSSKAGMSIGEKLQEFASRTVDLAGGINTSLEKIKKETEFLNAIIKNSLDSNAVMLESSKKVKTIISEQNAAINETSSSVEEITRSMNNIAVTTYAKKDTIDRLVETAGESAKEMDQSIRSIRELSRSAEDMLGIIKVIQEVASQTNVLAMNAAIEASHAGASGRGFAIVAQEIRKLSVETDKNSKLISATLKKSIGDIEKASGVNAKVDEYFHKMSAEVGEVKKAIDEIIVAVQEVSKGTGNILEAVSELLKMATDVDASMNEVDARISDSNGNIQNISKFTLELKQKTETIVKSFEDIIHVTRLIDKVGKENTAHIEKLDREITEIMK